MDHLAIADGLRELGALLEATGQPAFRVRAYERAAHTMDQVGDDDLQARIDERRLEELPAIGQGMARKIEQLASKGTLPELEELRKRVPTGFRELSRIQGLGPKRILALFEGLGIEGLDDLEQAVVEHRVRLVKGFSASSEARLAEAIARARARKDRHLWLDAAREAARLEPRLVAAGVERPILAGDARRAREEVEELVVVAAAAEPTRVARALAASLFGATQPTPTVVSARGADGLRIEVRVTRREAHAAATLFATGPAEHVALLVARARTRGLSLTDEGLAGADGQRIPVDGEAGLYAALDLPWIPPELRDDPDVLRSGDDLEDLLRVEDLIGMVHCHSTYSDGRNSIEEMARGCEALGMRYLTITDHSPSASYAGGVVVDDLKRQWDEIARVQELVPAVILLKGTESDILVDGALDYPDAILEQLDVVIGSIHQRHRLDRAAMTARLVHAMRLPVFKIWGHGLGRLVGKRDPIDCDVEQILDAMVESGRAAVEINSDPHRLDLPPEWVARARARSLPLVVSSDAHSVGGLSVLPFGVGIARRAGVRRQEVLNTLPVEAFKHAVRPAR